MLDGKQLTLLKKLIETPSVSKKDLSISLKMTNRQIDYSINKLNLIFKDNNLGQIEYDNVSITIPKPTYNYMLHLSASKFMSPELYIFDKDERLDILSLMLTNGGTISIKDISNTLGISKATTRKDLYQLKRTLDKYNLELVYINNQGYKIIGKERGIRQFITKIISNRIATHDGNILNWYFKTVQGIDLESLTKLIDRYSRKYNLLFVENNKLQFFYIFIAELPRIYEKPNYMHISKQLNLEISKTPEWNFAQALLEKFQIKNPNSIVYLSSIALCTTIGAIPETKIDSRIYDLNSKFVDQIITLTGVDFNNPLKIKEQIYTHFRSMYYRILFNFSIYNPLEKQVQKNYNDIYMIVKSSCNVIFKAVGNIPDSEIAFLTIHIISFIYKGESANTNRLKAAIVCPNGIGSSNLLYLQLSYMFPEIKFCHPMKIDDLYSNQNNIDLIFSTFYKAKLFMIKKPVFIVNPVMSIKEKEKLQKQVHSTIFNSTLFSYDDVMKIISATITNSSKLREIQQLLLKKINHVKYKPIKVDSRQKSLTDVFSPSFLQLNINAHSASEAIKIASTPLLQGGYINTHYIDALINPANDFYNGYIIAPLIVLPHSLPSNGAQKVGLSITSLKNPISFGNKFGGQVKYLFTLSAIDKTSHLLLLKQLLVLLDDSDFFTVLNQTNKDLVIQYMLKKLSEHSK